MVLLHLEVILILYVNPKYAQDAFIGKLQVFAHMKSATIGKISRNI